MRYMGGKFKIRKEVSGILRMLRAPGQVYLEPFVGGAWILQEMDGVRIAADKNTALITMYKALQLGWIPPDTITESEYIRIKNGNRDPYDPLTAFCGFGCTFGGVWFGGYARGGENRNYCKNARNTLLNQLNYIRDVEFKYSGYDTHTPDGMFVYCDPPYAGTSAYDAVGVFDSVKFWQKMREWSINNTVVISEYKAPEDFICIAEFKSRMGLRVTSGAQEIRTEKLFMYRG